MLVATKHKPTRYDPATDKWQPSQTEIIEARSRYLVKWTTDSDGNLVVVISTVIAVTATVVGYFKSEHSDWVEVEVQTPMFSSVLYEDTPDNWKILKEQFRMEEINGE